MMERQEEREGLYWERLGGDGARERFAPALSEPQGDAEDLSSHVARQLLAHLGLASLDSVTPQPPMDVPKLVEVLPGSDDEFLNNIAALDNLPQRDRVNVAVMCLNEDGMPFSEDELADSVDEHFWTFFHDLRLGEGSERGEGSGGRGWSVDLTLVSA